MVYNSAKYITDPMWHSYFIASQTFGDKTAALAEKIMRLETGNYQSEQFKKTFSAGMVAPAAYTAFPYGWGNMESFWKANPGLRPSHTWSTMVNGVKYNYIGFPTFTAGLMTLCEDLKQKGDDPVKYNGGADANYTQKLTGISNKYVV